MQETQTDLSPLAAVPPVVIKNDRRIPLDLVNVSEIQAASPQGRLPLRLVPVEPDALFICISSRIGKPFRCLKGAIAVAETWRWAANVAGTEA